MANTPSVLIVEDELELLEIFGFYATDFGYKTFTTPSAIEALRILETESIDVVMTDIKMPEMSGIDFLKQVKKRKLDVPFIICSASLLESELHAINDLKKTVNIIAMLEKPLEADRLEKTLATALSSV